MNKDALLLLASLLSIQLSKGLNAEELAVLSAFFTILGDNLALLSLSADSSSEQQATL